MRQIDMTWQDFLRPGRSRQGSLSIDNHEPASLATHTHEPRDFGFGSKMLASDRVHIEGERSDASGGDERYHPGGPADEAMHGGSSKIDGIGPAGHDGAWLS
jgi:hypothetical protein